MTKILSGLKVQKRTHYERSGDWYGLFNPFSPEELQALRVHAMLEMWFLDPYFEYGNPYSLPKLNELLALSLPSLCKVKTATQKPSQSYPIPPSKPVDHTDNLNCHNIRPAEVVWYAHSNS